MRVMYNYFDPSGFGKVKLAVEEVSYVFLDEKSSLIWGSFNNIKVEGLRILESA